MKIYPDFRAHFTTPATGPERYVPIFFGDLASNLCIKGGRSDHQQSGQLFVIFVCVVSIRSRQFVVQADFGHVGYEL